MKGLTLMLKSFGINIDPAEVEKAFHQAKSVIPQVATAFNAMNERQNEMNERLKRIEEKLAEKE